MKKLIILLTMIFSMTWLTACGTENVSGTSEEVESSAESGETPVLDSNVETTVSGSFTVTVRDVIPDYCFDGETPNVAVVTEFQSYPFTIYVGEEIGSQLVPGEVYVFTINPIVVNDSKAELEEMPLASLVWELSGFEIVDVRPAEEGEIGLNSLQLTFE